MKTKNEVLAAIMVKHLNGEVLNAEEGRLLAENSGKLTEMVKTAKKTSKEVETAEAKAAAIANHKVEVNKLVNDFVNKFYNGMQNGTEFVDANEVKKVFNDFLKTLPKVPGTNVTVKNGEKSPKSVKMVQNPDELAADSLSGLIWNCIVEAGEAGASKKDIKDLLSGKGYTKSTCNTQAGIVHKRFPVTVLENGNFVAN